MTSKIPFNEIKHSPGVLEENNFRIEEILISLSLYLAKCNIVLGTAHHSVNPKVMFDWIVLKERTKNIGKTTILG